MSKCKLVTAVRKNKLTHFVDQTGGMIYTALSEFDNEQLMLMIMNAFLILSKREKDITTRVLEELR